MFDITIRSKISQIPKHMFNVVKLGKNLIYPESFTQIGLELCDLRHFEENNLALCRGEWGTFCHFFQNWIWCTRFQQLVFHTFLVYSLQQEL